MQSGKIISSTSKENLQRYTLASPQHLQHNEYCIKERKSIRLKRNKTEREREVSDGLHKWAADRCSPEKRPCMSSKDTRLDRGAQTSHTSFISHTLFNGVITGADYITVLLPFHVFVFFLQQFLIEVDESSEQIQVSELEEL